MLVVHSVGLDLMSNSRYIVQTHVAFAQASVLAVHDELVIECDAADGDDVAAWVAACLQSGMTRYLTRVPVRVEVTVARDWSGTPIGDGASRAHSGGCAAPTANVRGVA